MSPKIEKLMAEQAKVRREAIMISLEIMRIIVTQGVDSPLRARYDRALELTRKPRVNLDELEELVEL